MHDEVLKSKSDKTPGAVVTLYRDPPRPDHPKLLGSGPPGDARKLLPLCTSITSVPRVAVENQKSLVRKLERTSSQAQGPVMARLEDPDFRSRRAKRGRDGRTAQVENRQTSVVG